MDDNKDLINEIDKLEDNKEIIEEKSTSHEKVFTIIVILIIIVALFMLYLSYKGTYIVSNKENKQDDFSAYLENIDNNEKDDNNDNNDNNSNNGNNENEEIDYEELENQKKEKFEQQKNNLSITSQMLSVDGKLIATIHNGNQESIENILVQVIFYNGEDKPIKIDQNTIDIFDSETDYYMFFQDTPKNYERCDFLITKENYGDFYISRKNDITFNVEENKEENEIKISGKNNSNEKIEEVKFSVIYYNENDQIIAIREESQYDIKKQKEFKIEIDNSLYSYETFEDIPYSRYEVLLLNAISYAEN